MYKRKEENKNFRTNEKLFYAKLNNNETRTSDKAIPTKTEVEYFWSNI